MVKTHYNATFTYQQSARQFDTVRLTDPYMNVITENTSYLLPVGQKDTRLG